MALWEHINSRGINNPASSGEVERDGCVGRTGLRVEQGRPVPEGFLARKPTVRVLNTVIVTDDYIQ